MMTPSIFGESLFDEFFDDFFNFPAIDDKAMQKAQKKKRHFPFSWTVLLQRLRGHIPMYRREMKKY